MFYIYIASSQCGPGERIVEMGEVEVVLDEIMTIAKVEGLYTTLEGAFPNGRETKIIASNVSRVDTSVLQVLIAFVAKMKTEGVPVTWGGRSDGFMAGVNLLGLENELDF